MSPDIKGQLAVLKIQQAALSKGIVSSVPIVPCRYDLVMEIDGSFKRVQCKYADGKSTNSTGAIPVRTASYSLGRTKTRTYNEFEIDLILAYIPSLDVIVKFEPVHFSGRTLIMIRTKPPKNNQKIGLNMIQDFLW